MGHTDAPYSPTLDALVDEVLNGFGLMAGPVAFLVQDVTESATTFVLSPGQTPSVGTAMEVDHELVLVASVDQQSGVVTTTTRGRGYRGSPATSHEAGALVACAPAIPRWTVIRAINAEIDSLYPAVMAVSALDSEVYDGVVPLDSVTDAVLDVRTLDSDGVTWERVRKWETESALPLSLAASGRAVIVPAVPDGTAVQVVVGSRPSLLTSADDDFVESGLPEQLSSLVVLGAALRILPPLDAYRLTMARVGNQEQAQLGPASLLAREWSRSYAERRDAATRDFRRLYPARTHFTR